MRWRGGRPRRWGAVVAAAPAVRIAAGIVTGIVMTVTGCSDGAHNGAPASSTRVPGAPGSAPAGAVGVSPGGVTTRVDVPAQSTEEEYYQACHAAKVWMDGQPGTGASLFEPYLAMLQASPSGTAGSWNAPWPTLTPARQAAVIIAARAAADNECG